MKRNWTMAIVTEISWDDMFGFLATFGDGLKSNIIYSSCTPRLHYVGEDKRFPHARASHTCTTSTRTALPWPATPRRMAGGPPKAACHHASSRLWWPAWLRVASAWVYAGARGRAVSAGPSRGAPTKRRLRRSRCARPNIWRFSILRRLICPSTGPVLHGSVMPALTAA